MDKLMTLTAALALALAASNAASQTHVAEFARVPHTTEVTAESATGNRTAPLTLFIEDPSGNPLRLVHVRGEGWRHASGGKAVDRAADPLQKTALSSTTPSQTTDALSPADEPLTVFIDGPSGFTYVWLRDAGWKFVGRIADGRP
jgi:hypothetical protein